MNDRKRSRFLIDELYPLIKIVDVHPSSPVDIAWIMMIG